MKKENNFVLDTSFISALINQNDLFHTEAFTQLTELSKKHKDLTLIAPITVALELTILLNRLGKAKYPNAIDLLNQLQIGIIEFTATEVRSLGTFLRKFKLSMKPIDASVCYTAHLHNANLLTFDEKLSKLSQNTTL